MDYFNSLLIFIIILELKKKTTKQQNFKKSHQEWSSLEEVHIQCLLNVWRNNSQICHVYSNVAVLVQLWVDEVSCKFWIQNCLPLRPLAFHDYMTQFQSGSAIDHVSAGPKTRAKVFLKCARFVSLTQKSKTEENKYIKKSYWLILVEVKAIKIII